MDSKQSLAKIGVFILLAGNVGAYWYFWPRHDDGARRSAKPALQEKGEAQLLPPKIEASIPAEPTQLPVEPLSEPGSWGGTLWVPIPSVFDGPGHKVRLATVLRLIDFIDKEKAPDLPPLPPAAESAKREEPTRLDASLIPIQPPDPGIAIASPLTAKTPPSLWLLQTGKIGIRTQLTARLNDAAGERMTGEFRIVCDRLETNPQSGAVQALGNVVFNGAGWRGTCHAMLLSAHEPRVVFEQQVQIMQDILGASQDGVLRGERFVWELPSAAAAPVSGVTLPLPRR